MPSHAHTHTRTFITGTSASAIKCVEQKSGCEKCRSEKKDLNHHPPPAGMRGESSWVGWVGGGGGVAGCREEAKALIIHPQSLPWKVEGGGGDAERAAPPASHAGTGRLAAPEGLMEDPRAEAGASKPEADVESATASVDTRAAPEHKRRRRKSARSAGTRARRPGGGGGGGGWSCLTFMDLMAS